MSTKPAANAYAWSDNLTRSFLIDGREYYVRPFHESVHISILLRLLPLISTLLVASPDIVNGVEGKGKVDLADFLKLSGPMLPVAQELKALESKGEAQKIMDSCLGVVGETKEGRIQAISDRYGHLIDGTKVNYKLRVLIALRVLQINMREMCRDFGFSADEVIEKILNPKTSADSAPQDTFPAKGWIADQPKAVV